MKNHLIQRVISSIDKRLLRFLWVRQGSIIYLKGLSDRQAKRLDLV